MIVGEFSWTSNSKPTTSLLGIKTGLSAVRVQEEEGGGGKEEGEGRRWGGEIHQKQELWKLTFHMNTQTTQCTA